MANETLEKQSSKAYSAKGQNKFLAEMVNNVFDSLQVEEVLTGEIAALTNSGSDPYNYGSIDINYKNQQRSRPPQVLVSFNGMFLPIFSAIYSSSGLLETQTYAVAKAYRTKVSITFYDGYLYSAPIRFVVYVLKDKLGKR